MSEWITNACIAGAIVWTTLLAYRLYFNVPESYDIGEETVEQDTIGQESVGQDTLAAGLVVSENSVLDQVQADTVPLEAAEDSPLEMQEIYDTADEETDTLTSLIPQSAG